MKDKKQLWQAVKFTLFSISAGVIQIGCFALLEIFAKDYWIPYLISLVLSILWNFTLNRRYTFKSAANVPIAMAKVLVSIWCSHRYLLTLGIWQKDLASTIF